MSPGGGYVDPEVALILIGRAARLAILEIAVAIEAADDDGIAIGSTRLCWAVATAEHVARSANGAVVEQLDRLRARTAPWMSKEPLVFSTDTIERFLARIAAQRAELAPRIDATNTDLVGLDLDDLDLSGCRFHRAYLTDIAARRAVFERVDATDSYMHECRFYGASFRGATLDGAGMTDSDLSCTSFYGSSWRGAELAGCTILGASFADACLDGATFTDCELRGVSFAAATSQPTARGARFIDCDLRDTRWTARDLCGVSLIDCKLFGAHGAPVASDVVIERPDLSSDGNRSRMGTRGDVLAAWAGVVGPGIDRSRAS